MLSVAWLLPTSLILSYIMPLHCFFWSRKSLLPSYLACAFSPQGLGTWFSLCLQKLAPYFAYLTNTHLSDLSSSVSSSRNFSLASSTSCPVIFSYRIYTFSLQFSCLLQWPNWSFSCLVHRCGCFCRMFYSQCLSQCRLHSGQFINIC